VFDQNRLEDVKKLEALNSAAAVVRNAKFSWSV
jgi:hypothetical protein